jgi:transporter family-2 protein
MKTLLSSFIGALISIMIMLNGTLSNSYGNYTSTVIIHLTGLFSIIFILLITRTKFKFKKNIPIYLYSAGAIGIFTVLFNNLSYSTLGVAVTIALGLLGQSITAIIIDHFGLLGMDIIRFRKEKFIGLILVSFGILVMTIF